MSKTTVKSGAKPVPPGTLRRGQLRILQALVKCAATDITTAVPIMGIAKSAKVSRVMILYGLGPVDTQQWDAHNTRYGYKCLLSRGLVKVLVDPEQGALYYLTARGAQQYAVVSGEAPLKVTRPNRNQYTGGR